jgi:3-oxoacyl-[acyl-carrier protein] reductase
MTFLGKVALAARGASLVVNYLKNAATASQVVARIHANGGQALAVQADIREKSKEICCLLDRSLW